jgi:hypothetical protein
MRRLLISQKPSPLVSIGKFKRFHREINFGIILVPCQDDKTRGQRELIRTDCTRSGIVRLGHAWCPSEIIRR